MTAGTLTGLNATALNSILRQTVTMSLHRGAAAALTVAFEICKTDHLSRGEKISDDLIKNEIRDIFHQMMAITDPDIAAQQAKQNAMKSQRQP